MVKTNDEVILVSQIEAVLICNLGVVFEWMSIDRNLVQAFYSKNDGYTAGRRCFELYHIHQEHSLCGGNSDKIRVYRLLMKITPHIFSQAISFLFLFLHRAE